MPKLDDLKNAKSMEGSVDEKTRFLQLAQRNNKFGEHLAVSVLGLSGDDVVAFGDLVASTYIDCRNDDRRFADWIAAELERRGKGVAAADILQQLQGF